MCQVKGGKCSFENALAEKRNDNWVSRRNKF